jgi:hypothetical protein
VFPRAREGVADLPGDEPIAARRARVCQLLASLYAGASVLIVTRGFQGALASLYSHALRVGDTRDYDAYVSRHDPSAAGGIKLEEYFDYDATIRLYESHFGSDNVIVLPFELMREDPAAFIAALEERMALPRSGDTFPWLNSSLSAAELAWYPRFSRAAWTGVHVANRLGLGGDGIHAAYRAHIGGPGLRRAATLLARLVGTQPPEARRAAFEDLLPRFRGRAETLAGRSVYVPFLAEYLIDGA